MSSFLTSSVRIFHRSTYHGLKKTIKKSTMQIPYEKKRMISIMESTCGSKILYTSDYLYDGKITIEGDVIIASMKKETEKQSKLEISLVLTNSLFFFPHKLLECSDTIKENINYLVEKRMDYVSSLNGLLLSSSQVEINHLPPLKFRGSSKIEYPYSDVIEKYVTLHMSALLEEIN